MKKSTYRVIGAMAGSSMDGLDLALVKFNCDEVGWGFELLDGTTIPYHKELEERLSKSPVLTHQDQLKLDDDFGQWISNQIITFGIHQVDLLAIHGHTVIHEPKKGISWQLGNGELIAKNTRATTVTDFRAEDIRLGGQGAPLVPFGDFHLFPDYDACLNLGGICNVSIKKNQTAWDICPCNQVLNYFSNQLGQEYDKDGRLAKAGEFDLDFYNQLTQLNFFSEAPPKSLANNYLKEEFLSSIDPIQGLHTYSHFIARQISKDLKNKGNRLLVTGGGAFNTYLIDLLKKELSSWEIIVPDPKLVEFKEAIVFAFLGLKRLIGEVNVLSSTTGASEDSSSGVIHLP
ncbi:anhydro-N-acetylmuramic acid kinase [Ekhidna sp.]|uniref:anhydro-N-acetylmuramic acid kinase n=1 Tax=Ekhidna sp. TaxID=2608089 RepID=UPI003CCB85D7